MTDLKIENAELKRKINRRNVLLDNIRKAYHRDVLSIKEYLVKVQSGKSVEPLKGGDLGSSVDLREGGFPLYSPEDCELFLQPCSNCGGQLEIIHRENKRIASLQNKEIKLQSKLSGLKKKLLEMDENRIVAIQNCKKLKTETDLEKTGLHSQIEVLMELVNDLADVKQTNKHLNEKINALEVSVAEKEFFQKQLFQCESNLNEVNKENQELTVTKTKVESDLDHVNSLLKEANKREADVKLEVKELENCNKAMHKELTDAKDEIIQLEHNVENLSKINESKCLELEESKLSLEASNERLKKQKETNELNIVEHTKKEESLRSTLTKLKTELIKKDKDVDYFRVKLDEMCRRRDENDSSLVSSKAGKKKSDNEMDSKATRQLKEKVTSLINFTSSYVRGLYDFCKEQEHLLRTEKYNASNQKALSIEGNLKEVLDALFQSKDSKDLDWDELLKNEEDRRKISGNLCNQMQIGLSKINNVFDSLKKRHESEIRRLMKQNQKALDDMKSSHQDKIQSVEEKLSKAIHYGESCDRRIVELSHSCDETKKNYLKRKNHCSLLEGNLKEKQLEYNAIKKKVDGLNRCLEEKGEEIGKCKQQVETLNKICEEKEDEIQYKDGAIDSMEKVLNKSTSRYAELVAKERHRLDTNIDVGIQETISKANFGSQVDFIVPIELPNDTPTKKGSYVVAQEWTLQR